MPSFFKNPIVLCIFIILILIITVFFLKFNFMGINKSFVRINSLEIPVEVAASVISQAKGLSGRPSLDSQSGMLFIFSKPAIRSFWMRNMNFPIDIIWINDGKIVDISANIPNDFSLMNPRTYKPSQPAQYVLEVNAGFAEKENIKIGDTVSFINISN